MLVSEKLLQIFQRYVIISLPRKSNSDVTQEKCAFLSFGKNACSLLAYLLVLCLNDLRGSNRSYAFFGAWLPAAHFFIWGKHIMKPIVKKAISLFLVLIFTFSGISAISANAVTANEILNKLAILDNNGSTWGSYGNLKPGSSFTNGQCWQYVKGISSYVYGTTVSIPNTASYLGGGSLGEYYRVSAALTNCSYEQIVSLLKTSQPGDIIGFKNSKVDATYGHIMFIGNVTNQKITFYQAASGYARKDTVDLTVAGLKGLYSFGYSGNASFASSSYGISLFRCNRRTGVDDWSTTPTDTSKPEITVNVGTSTTNTTITLSKKNTSASRHDLHIYYADGTNYLVDSFDNTNSYSVKLPEGTFSIYAIAVVNDTQIWSDMKRATIPKTDTSKPEVSVTAGTSTTNTTITLSKKNTSASRHDLHIYYADGTNYLVDSFDNTNSYSVKLPEGTFSIYAIAVVNSSQIWSDMKRVSIPKGRYSLTVNYYSNYADKSFDSPLNAVGSNKNVLVKTAYFHSDTEYSAGLHNYSASSSGTYLGRTGYTATGKWNTKPDGSGYSVDQNTAFSNGQALAQAVGKNISNADASVNLYPEWNLNTYTATLDHWCYGFNSKGTNGRKDMLKLATTSKNFTYSSGISVTTSDRITPDALPNGVRYCTWFGSGAFSDSWVNYGYPQTFNNVAKNVSIQINYELIDYNITYDLGGGTLAEPNPATYNVVFGATFANAPTRAGYTFAGWTINGETVTGVNEAELDDSVFVNDAGLAGGAFYEAVKDRTSGNITVKAKWIANTPAVNPAAGSGTVVDESKHFLYGLSAASGQGCVAVTDGTAAYEYPTARQVMGTGTKVNVFNNDNQLVDSYTVVVFGDIDGDGWYDGTDAYFVGLVANGLISQSALTAAQLAACDANHDDAIDAADVALLEQAGLLLANVDQTLPSEELQTDSVYLEYCSLIDQSVTITEPEQPATEQPQSTAQNILAWFRTIFTVVLNWITGIFNLQIA